MASRRRRLPNTFLILLGALLVPTSLSGCGSSGGGGTVTRDTTVMVYFVGSNLTAGAIGNIHEMMAVGSSAGMSVLIQTGGSERTATEPAENENAMQPENIDWTHVQRYLVNKGSLDQLDDLGAESKASPEPAIDMGDPATLAAFLEWGATNYPAKHYILVLWDHGGGVNGGFGTDDITGSRLSVAAIGETLDAAQAAQGVKFEVVGYDACLMANAEVAASLRAASSYMVASQDDIDSLSWDYVPFLEYVRDNPGASGAAIGRVIVDGFAAKMRANEIEPFTLSVVDLSKAQALSDATDSFAQELMKYTAGTTGNPAAWRQIALARSRALDWGTSAIYGQSRDLVDMRAFVSGVVEAITTAIAPDLALTAAGTALEEALDAAVVYEISVGSDLSATGLSLYFPSILSSYPDEHYPAHTAVDGNPYFAPGYTSAAAGLVEAYYTFYGRNTTALEASVEMSADPAHPLDALIRNGFDSALAAHWDPSCKLYTDPGPLAPAVTAPCYSGMQTVQGTGSVVDTTVTFAYGNEWPKIMGHPVVMLPDHVASVRLFESSYLIPAYLYSSTQNGTGYEAGYLKVEEIEPAVPGDSPYRVSGFQADALVPGKTKDLVNGQVYALGAYYVDDQGTRYFFRTDQTVMVTSGSLRIESSAIADGEFAYFVTDLTGAVWQSRRVSFTPEP